MNDFVRRKRHVGATAFAALVAACASAPPASTQGEEELAVWAVSWTAKPDLFQPPGPLRVPEQLQGVRCTLANDKGTWTATTPGTVRVQRSSAPLVVDCALEGYLPVRATLHCRSPRQATQKQDNFGMVMAIVKIPLAVAAAPIAPQITAQVAGEVLIDAAFSAASHASMGSDADLCTYGSVGPAMTPQPR